MPGLWMDPATVGAAARVRSSIERARIKELLNQRVVSSALPAPAAEPAAASPSAAAKEPAAASPSEDDGSWHLLRGISYDVAGVDVGQAALGTISGIGQAGGAVLNVTGSALQATGRLLGSVVKQKEEIKVLLQQRVASAPAPAPPAAAAKASPPAAAKASPPAAAPSPSTALLKSSPSSAGSPSKSSSVKWSPKLVESKPSPPPPVRRGLLGEPLVPCITPPKNRRNSSPTGLRAPDGSSATPPRQVIFLPPSAADEKDGWRHVPAIMEADDLAPAANDPFDSFDSFARQRLIDAVDHNETPPRLRIPSDHEPISRVENAAANLAPFFSLARSVASWLRFTHDSLVGKRLQSVATAALKLRDEARMLRAITRWETETLRRLRLARDRTVPPLKWRFSPTTREALKQLQRVPDDDDDDDEDEPMAIGKPAETEYEARLRIRPVPLHARSGGVADRIRACMHEAAAVEALPDAVRDCCRSAVRCL